MFRLIRRGRLWVGVGLLAVLSSAATAGTGDVFDADIYRDDGSVTVWADLSASISSERVELLKEGVDLALSCQVDLLRSRRFWGAVRVERSGLDMVVGFHLLAEEYSLRQTSSAQVESNRRFATLAGLHQYLADSVVIRLAPIDSLESGRRYHVEISVFCISLTSFNLGPSGEAKQTPLKYLFRQFLSLTGYGREHSLVTSDPFRLSDLRSGR